MPADVARIKELFLALLEKTGPQRTALLDSECAGDAELRRRLETMLRSHETSGELLRDPAELLAEADAGRSPTTDFSDSPEAAGDSDLVFLAPATKPGDLGRLGHYAVREVLGRGGFGVVLKAFDDRLHRVVAIKALAPAYAANGSARKRFIREARAAAAVKNEHVVGIHDVQEDSDPPYLVMECIDGINLQDKLDKRGPLGIKEILRIGMQIAEGLAAAHKQGLVHRDIKPANILLENGVERVKITDFGLARAVDDASVTQSGTVAGTPMYMSPEQAEGLPIDHRSDLFSLGTVLYAMCTGHPPFRATGTHAVLKRVIEAAPRPIREINDEIPEWLAAVIGRLHAKSPADRFQTAREIAEMLGRHLADVQAGRSVPSEPSARTKAPDVPIPGRANRRRWALRGAVALLVLTLAAVWLGRTIYPWGNGSKLASIVVAAEPSVLAWSPDGRYLAAGTMNSSRTRYADIHAVGGKMPEGPGKVFIVDIGKESVIRTIETDLGVTGLAFSPDSRWLAAATRDFGGGKTEWEKMAIAARDIGHGKTEAELVVFDVGGFPPGDEVLFGNKVAPTYKAKSGGAKPGYFQDLAWRADSKSLHAIDHGPDQGAKVRRWTIPDFVEQPAISIESGQIDALAAAPDGRTVAIVQHEGTPNTATPGTTTLRLFNLEKGTEIWSRKEDELGARSFSPGPVGFTADSEAVGVPDAEERDGKPQSVAWWNAETGKAAKLAEARFAVCPASLAETRDHTISPDMRTRANAWNGLGSGRGNWSWPEAGIRFTQRDPGKEWYWDFEKMGSERRGALWAIPGPPALAFSSDGKKLAGALKLPSGWMIAIWAFP